MCAGIVCSKCKTSNRGRPTPGRVSPPCFSSSRTWSSRAGPTKDGGAPADGDRDPDFSKLTVLQPAAAADSTDRISGWIVSFVLPLATFPSCPTPGHPVQTTLTQYLNGLSVLSQSIWSVSP